MTVAPLYFSMGHPLDPSRTTRPGKWISLKAQAILVRDFTLRDFPRVFLPQVDTRYKDKRLTAGPELSLFLQ